MFVCIFFFKQKTAYEMRISDWSSDVCSSDLIETLQRKLPSNLDRLRRAADNAMAGAVRATNLTQHLLAFSRKQPLNPRPVAVNRQIGRASCRERVCQYV